MVGCWLDVVASRCDKFLHKSRETFVLFLIAQIWLNKLSQSRFLFVKFQHSFCLFNSHRVVKKLYNLLRVQHTNREISSVAFQNRVERCNEMKWEKDQKKKNERWKMYRMGNIKSTFVCISSPFFSHFLFLDARSTRQLLIIPKTLRGGALE